jgi:hypothetical protein
VVDDLPVRIDRDEVLRFQGYKKGVDVPSGDVLALFDEALALGERLMAPRLVYCAAAVSEFGPDRIVAAGQVLGIPGIGRLWGAIQAVGAGICTVGDAIETRVGSLFAERELPLAVMLDSVGSAAVESLAEYANDLLCQSGLRDGLRVTNRISPGYAGWDTAEQAALWRLCPGEPIGVAINAACFMTPAKTISFLVGIGPEARVDHYFTQCRRCWMSDCAYRRTPAGATVRRAPAGEAAPGASPFGRDG